MLLLIVSLVLFLVSSGAFLSSSVMYIGCIKSSMSGISSFKKFLLVVKYHFIFAFLVKLINSLSKTFLYTFAFR